MIAGALRLLAALRDLLPQGLRELRVLGTLRQRRFFAVDAPEPSLRNLLTQAVAVAESGADVYFGLNPRHRAAGDRDSVLAAVATVLDIDSTEAWNRVEQLAGFGARPAAVVASGSGAHAYYFFDRPLPPAEGEDLGARLCAFARSDPSYDGARCPRLPGTVNWKWGNRVWLVELSCYRTPVAVLRQFPKPIRAAGKIVASPWAHLTPLKPDDVIALPFSLRRMLESYEHQDRSRTDAAVAVACYRARLPDETVIRLLLWPPQSKLAEKLRTEGVKSAGRYLERTLRWATSAAQNPRRASNGNVLRAG